MKTVSLWILALLMLAAPGAAEAITVSIQVQKTGFTSVTATPTVTFTDHTGKLAVALACDTAAKVATAAACTRVVSIGGTPVTIRDLGPCTSVATCVRARIYRDDGQSSDILNIAGLLATFGTGTTTAAPVTLKISYSSNEFTKLNYSSGYSYTAVMSGAFFNGGATATRCLAPFTTACLTLRLTANNTIVNQFGDSAVATVNVPQIGAVGAFGPPGNPSETKSIPCGTINVLLSCTPSLQGALTAISVKANDTLKIAGGAAIAGSHRPTTAGGVTDTFVDVGVPEFVNTPVPVNFVRYDQAATLNGILAQDGGLFPKLQIGGAFPLWWNLEKVDESTPPVTTEATVLKSIVTNTDGFDDGSYVSAVPTNFKATQSRDLTSLVAVYDSYVGCPGSPSNFFFVEIQLKTTPVQAIRVLLDCGASSGVNLVTSTNVVKLPDGSTTNWKGLVNSKFGGVEIGAISVFLTPILNPVPVDQEVNLASLTFVAFKTTFTQSGGQTPTFVDMKCDFPGLNEFRVRATPVDSSGQPAGPPFIWGDDPNETFTKFEGAPTAGDCQLRTQIPVNLFPASDRESGWRFELLYNLRPSGVGTVFLFSN
jgi:hypothetical protein